MNRIYLLIVALFMMLASCSNSNDDVEQGENSNTNKESIVALWQDSDKKRLTRQSPWRSNQNTNDI